MMSPNLTTPGAEKTPWGWKRTAHFDHGHLVEHVHIDAGGYSPKHRHYVNFDDFFVLSGMLLVHVYDSAGGPGSRTQILKPGDKLSIPPEIWHRLEAVDGPVELIEVLWKDHITAADVVCADDGGVRDRSAVRAPAVACCRPANVE